MSCTISHQITYWLRKVNINDIQKGFLLALILLTPSLSNALTMEEQNYECPLGGEKFTSTVVNSYYQSGQRLDLKLVGALIAPYLPVCPGNGFILYQQEFSKEQIEQLETFILSSEYQRLRKSNTDYFLLAKIFEYQKKDMESIAYLYLQASWEAEEGERDRYIRYLKLAIGAYQAVLDQNSISPDTEFAARFFLVGLNRLQGHFKLAKSTLLNLEKHVEVSGFKRKLIELRTQAYQRQ